MGQKELSSDVKKPRVALVCDWLTTVGGAESVLLALHKMYPEAPIYTSKYNKKGIDWFLDADVRTGWLQFFPTCLRRFISPLRQHYFSHLDLSDYDLVISVTGAEAKAVKTKKTEQNTKNSEQTEHHCVHLCYCHVPTQYYWQMYDEYLKNPGFGILNPLARIGLKLFVKPMRKKDFAAAQRPDEFITISEHAKEQIKKYYKREAKIIYPPVDLEKFSTELSTNNKMKPTKSQAKNRYNYITTSRQVNWKRLDLAILACIKADQNLTVIGDGPEHKKLVKLAGGSQRVRFLPHMSQDELKIHLEKADAYIFPSLEPFGIAPIEAMSLGLPVIAYGEGGALDYVKPNLSGALFAEQTVGSLAKVLESFDPSKFSKSKIIESVARFDKSIFVEKMQREIREKLS